VDGSSTFFMKGTCMTKRLLLTVAALIVLPASWAHAQTADEVVEKVLTALGGRAALGKLTSRTATGTISVTTPVGDLTGTIELYNKAPNKVRTVVKIDASSVGVGQILQDQRFDGTAGYAIDSLNGNRDLTGDQVEIMRSSTFPTPLLRYKEEGARVELLGKEKVGDRDAYVLRFTPKTGPASRQFMDAETYLLVKSVVTVNVPQLGTDIEQTVEMSDYRDVDGVKVPYRTRSVNQVQSLTITFTKVEHNKAIDDGSFAKPAQ
jgi:outer membrane lipoprotein-sorting protein